ncbi:hypothetical protein AB0G20_37815 [Streptomyces sp. NPDC024017]|uniref:hypothetical protein n=1 Tax=Streptomyces sp. NPDC024017 TaxID=3154326 RepID=UPI003407381F
MPANGWTENQRSAWHAAWKAWVDAARDVQAAISDYAVEQGCARRQVEADVKEAAIHPRPTT